MKMKDFKFRFWESPVEELFKNIRLTAKPRLEVSSDLSLQLDRYLNQAIEFCTKYLDSTYPVLYRVRKNEDSQFEKFSRSKMGPPSASGASAGRAQLEGLPMLYLAEKKLTAIMEVRPDVEQYITVGNFRIKSGKRLKILDLSRFNAKIITKPPQELEGLIRLSRYAFSTSVHPERLKKYHAHAYFVQKICDMGYDGIGYESAVHKNHRCFAFFDASNFKCTRTELQQVKTISIQVEPVIFSLTEKNFIAKQKANKISK